MKNAIYILCLIFLSNLLFGQDENKPLKKFAPELLPYKNEVSLDHGGIISFLYSEGEIFSTALTYKRFLKNNKTLLRSGFRTTLMRNSYSGEDYFVTREISPSAIRVDYFEERNDSKNNQYSMRLGIEHRFGSGRVKFLLGVDIIAGLEKFNNQRWWIITTGIQELDSVNTTVQFDEFQNSTTYDVPHEILYFNIGFTPLVGAHIHLSDRLSLNAVFMAEYLASFPLKSEGDFSREGEPGSYFGTGSPYIFDISITYHF